MPQPVIPVRLTVGTVGPVRGITEPPRQSTVVSRASIRRPLGHAAPGAIVAPSEDLPSAPPVKKDPPKPPHGTTRRKSIRREDIPPPAVVKVPRPKSPQIVTQRSSSRSSSRPRRQSNLSLPSAEKARSKAKAPVRKSRSTSPPRKSGAPSRRPGTPPHVVERKLRNAAPQPGHGSVQPPTVIPRSTPRRPSPPRVVHMETASRVVKPTSRPSTPVPGVAPALVGEHRRRAVPPPPAVVKAPRPESPQIVIQRPSSRSSLRPRRQSNPSVPSADKARSKAKAPVRKSRSTSPPRKSGAPPRRPGTPPHVVERKSRNLVTLPVPRSVQLPTVIPRPKSRRSSPSRVHMETAGPVVQPTSSPGISALGRPFSNNQLSDNLPSSKSLFKRAPSSGALTMSIAQLFQYLSSTPSGSISSLVRHKESRGVRHEFLVMHARGPSGPSLWLRVERAAEHAQSWFRLSSSTFPAKDTARICGSEKEIFYEKEPSTVEAEVRFDSPPTLLDLKKLLTIVTEESANYKLLSENCFFFAAAVQENLLARHGGYLFSGKKELMNVGQDVRARIRARFEES